MTWSRRILKRVGRGGLTVGLFGQENWRAKKQPACLTCLAVLTGEVAHETAGKWWLDDHQQVIM